ncbi:helix-turn-helix domain-containing protein [Caloramator sp. ALD01]|uniref:helix-turn-helix domain-containing protein n=1 Tax=Caloramator sp. ALD01 TaxID=1031288 RepID=UPI00042525EB|nr:helix-turn-helix domain-containing protein [Caloramator sp. ALD01]
MEEKKNYYTFKEVCQLTGYKDSVIRYYEKEFELNIQRDTKGRRIFSPNDLNILLQIKNLQEKGLTNGQIKKILMNQETAITSLDAAVAFNDNDIDENDQDKIKLIEEKLNAINQKLEEIDKNVFSKERDILISENMKLKMELKQKCYEIIELKEKLKYEKQTKKGILSKLFRK